MRDKFNIIKQILAENNYIIDLEQGKIYNKNYRELGYYHKHTKQKILKLKSHYFSAQRFFAYCAGMFDSISDPQNYHIVLKDQDKTNLKSSNLMIMKIHEKNHKFIGWRYRNENKN